MSKEYKCTDCDADATIGYSDWWAGDKQISTEEERLCSKCHTKRMKGFTHDQ